MSDINKLVAAILTAGRMPTVEPTVGRRGYDEWLTEYNMWVRCLDNQDAKLEAENGERFVESLKNL